MSSGEDMARHVLAQAQNIDVRHACPECVIGHANAFCPVCLGDGLISVDRLNRYLVDQQRQTRGIP